MKYTELHTHNDAFLQGYTHCHSASLHMPATAQRRNCRGQGQACGGMYFGRCAGPMKVRRGRRRADDGPTNLHRRPMRTPGKNSSWPTCGRRNFIRGRRNFVGGQRNFIGGRPNFIADRRSFVGGRCVADVGPTY